MFEYDNEVIERFPTIQAAAIYARGLATGSELFTELGSTDPVTPDPGEVVFVDRDDEVCARRWCWRQSAQSATNWGTTDALIVVEGHHQLAALDVAAAVRDLIGLLAKHQPGYDAETWHLSAARSSCLQAGDVTS